MQKTAITELAKDSDSDVRRNTAGNPNTPVEVLTELAKDSDSDVRSSTAGNPNTPVEVLTELAKDSDSDVRRNFIIGDNYVATKGTIIFGTNTTERSLSIPVVASSEAVSNLYQE